MGEGLEGGCLRSERPVNEISMCSSYHQKNCIQLYRKICAAVPGMMAQGVNCDESQYPCTAPETHSMGDVIRSVLFDLWWCSCL